MQASYRLPLISGACAVVFSTWAPMVTCVRSAGGGERGVSSATGDGVSSVPPPALPVPPPPPQPSDAPSAARARGLPPGARATCLAHVSRTAAAVP